MNSYTESILGTYEEEVKKEAQPNLEPSPTNLTFDVRVSGNVEKRFKDNQDDESQEKDIYDLFFSNLSVEAVDKDTFSNSALRSRSISFHYHRPDEKLLDKGKFDTSKALLIYNGVHILDYLSNTRSLPKVVIIDDEITLAEMNKEDIHFLIECPHMEHVKKTLKVEGYTVVTTIEELEDIVK